MPDTVNGGSDSPRRHRLVNILSAQNNAIALNTEILSVIARRTASIDNQLSAIVRSLSEFHGKREAAESEEVKDRRKKEITLNTILHEVRKAMTRVTAVETELEELRIHALIGRNEPGDKSGEGGPGAG